MLPAGNGATCCPITGGVRGWASRRRRLNWRYGVIVLPLGYAGDGLLELHLSGCTVAGARTPWDQGHQPCLRSPD